MLQAEEWSTAVHGFAVFPMHRGSGLTARYSGRLELFGNSEQLQIPDTLHGGDPP